MADFIRQLNGQLASRGLAKTALLMLTFGAAAAGVVVLWLWLQKPELQILYSNLSAEDASAVVGKLRDGHIPYELSSDGAAILVPSDQVHELRLQLASQGLPQGGGVGFELFDRNTFGATEFVQKLNYKRALQGELTRTISQLSEVSQARVHLVTPERALFSDRQEAPRASVVLTLRPGRVLSETQVQGVVHLVASSVEGLQPDAVTVVDSHGRILSKSSGGESETFKMTNSQLDYRRAVEKDMENKIQTMLEQVVGPGKAAVRVSAVLDLRQVELTEEKFDPDTAAVRSEQRSQEKASGSSESGASGIPGVTSNVPPAAQTQAPAAANGTTNQNNSQKKNEVINYELSKTVSRIIEPVGTIKTLSVAALVDGTYEAAKGTNNQATRKYVPRTAEEMKKLEDLVKNAMGYSQTRQDQVVVTNVPFENNGVIDEETAAPQAAPVNLSKWLPIIRYGVGLILAMIVMLFIIRPILGVLTAGSRTASMGAVQLQGEGEIVRPALPPRDQFLQIARENPQAAAGVVKRWVQEK